MTLGEFRQKTKHLTDDAELFLPEVEMPGYRDVRTVNIAKVGRSMDGPYPQKQPTHEREVGSKWGIFF